MDCLNHCQIIRTADIPNNFLIQLAYVSPNFGNYVSHLLVCHSKSKMDSCSHQTGINIVSSKRILFLLCLMIRLKWVEDGQIYIRSLHVAQFPSPNRLTSRCMHCLLIKWVITVTFQPSQIQFISNIAVTPTMHIRRSDTGTSCT